MTHYLLPALVFVLLFYPCLRIGEYLAGVLVGVLPLARLRGSHDLQDQAPAIPSRPPVDAPAPTGLALSAPHSPDAAHDPVTLGNGVQFLLDQAHAQGVPLRPEEARAMAARMLNGEEV